MTAEENLNKLGITLPAAPTPAANYVPYVVVGDMVYISGQLPMVDGKLRTEGGWVGNGVLPEEAKAQARLCAINLIAQLKAACGGDLTKVKRVVKLGGFVACAGDFKGQPDIINGASDLMVEIFEDKGQHARFAVGTNALPLGTVVEVEGLFQITTIDESPPTLENH